VKKRFKTFNCPRRRPKKFFPFSPRFFRTEVALLSTHLGMTQPGLPSELVPPFVFFLPTDSNYLFFFLFFTLISLTNVETVFPPPERNCPRHRCFPPFPPAARRPPFPPLFLLFCRIDKLAPRKMIHPPSPFFPSDS